MGSSANVTPINDYLADSLINDLQQEIYRGEDTLSAIPKTLRIVIDRDLWRERVVQATGELVRFDRFEDFVTAPPLEGLGSSVRQLKHLCRDDKAALDALDRATVAERGRPHKAEENVSNRNNKPDKGTTASYALRKLRKDRPDLHEQVLQGALSPHKAMIEAGFRKKTLTVPADLDAAGRALIKHFDPDELYGAMIEARLQ